MSVDTDYRANRAPALHHLRDGAFEKAVYSHVPTSEMLGIFTKGIARISESLDAISIEDVDHQLIDRESADEFARRVARFALGYEPVIAAFGVDRKRAYYDILAGRRAKYSDQWESTIEQLTNEARVRGDNDFQPTPTEIKQRCRDRWGKWQFKLTDEQFDVIDRMHQAYSAACDGGLTHEVASATVCAEFPVEAYVIPYTTATGEERTFDLSTMMNFTPELPDLVEDCAQFEQAIGQDAAGSISQLRSELAEVGELLGFIDAKSQRNLYDVNAQGLELKFADIDEFKASIDVQYANGVIGANDYIRYSKIQSLEELSDYIQQNLAYEAIDVVTSAGGLLSRMNVDIHAAFHDALEDREAFGLAARLIRAIAMGLGASEEGPHAATPHSARDIRIALEVLLQKDDGSLREDVAVIAPIIPTIVTTLLYQRSSQQ